MTDKHELVFKLSEGYSTQAKTANKFWLVLLITSVIALTGNVQKVLDPVTGNSENLIELPFTLGKVDPLDFYSVIIILISVLVIACVSSMAQTIRNRLLIDRLIKSLPQSDLYIENVHIQDYFDSVASPTYIRVAPISQFLLGKKQFFGSGKPHPFLRIIASILYVILKLASFAFIYLLPFFAVKKSWEYLQNHSQSGSLNIPGWLIQLAIILAGTTMFILLIADFKYLGRVFKKISK